MNRNFTEEFKIQAVEKALGRTPNTSLKEVALSLGVGCSTLNKWIVRARNQEFEPVSSHKTDRMMKDKRPQDWTLEERFNMVMTCQSLDDEALSESCRLQGIYPYHVKQWRVDFISGHSQNEPVVSRSELRTLKHENKALKKELLRKEKALAETAALLVLQKKVHAIWSSTEDTSL